MRLLYSIPRLFLLGSLTLAGCAELGEPGPPAADPAELATATASLSAPLSSASSSTSSSPSSPAAHEPWVDLSWAKFPASTAPRINVIEIDRPFRLSFNWWTNGTPYPSLFRFTGRSPSGAVTAGELSADPILDFTPLPGETTLTVDIEHQSDSPEFRANLLFEQEIKPEELGRCGDQVRDLFLRWVNSREPWRGDPWYTHAHEQPPSSFQLIYSRGASSHSLDYRLRGVLTGSRGPILQVEYKSAGRLRLNALLFFDGQGQLLRQVDGLYYFTMPDGNLLVSSGMANDGTWSTPWYQTSEAVKAVSPAGDVIWQRVIGGKPPGRLVITAAGNFVMPWALDEGGGRSAAIHEFDPRTGATVNETFIDRSELCTEASAAPACVEARPRVVSRFEAWWSEAWRIQLPGASPVGPRQACDRYTCITGVLTGWTQLGEEDVIEVALNSVNNGRTYRNSLLFVDASGRRTVGGKLLRRLAPDRLLVSTAVADSGFVSSTGTPWYYTQEKLAAVGARGAIAWQRQVGGPPALFSPPSSGGGTGADGYLLPQNQLFWAAWAMRDGSLTSQNVWLDLATGAVLPVPARRTLEGVCVP